MYEYAFSPTGCSSVLLTEEGRWNCKVYDLLSRASFCACNAKSPTIDPFCVLTATEFSPVVTCVLTSIYCTHHVAENYWYYGGKQRDEKALRSLSAGFTDGDYRAFTRHITSVCSGHGRSLIWCYLISLYGSTKLKWKKLSQNKDINCNNALIIALLNFDYYPRCLILSLCIFVWFHLCLC